MKNSVYPRYKEHIDSSDMIIMACSWWVDSMVLLNLLMGIHPHENIIVAHFDHSIRWQESHQDREFVELFCMEHKLLLEAEKEDILALAKTEKRGIEEMARIRRYEFLERIREKYHAKWILTAHHQDDRIETADFNLIRGTKLWGIHALTYEQWYILRLFLDKTKEEIVAFSKKHAIPYRDDSSNQDDSYLRNRLRNTILPLFSEINPEYRRALANFIHYTEEAKEWIDQTILAWLLLNGNRSKKEWRYFSVSSFCSESSFLQKEIIRFLYEEANRWTIGLSEGSMDELLRFIHEAGNMTEKEINKLRLEKKWDAVYIV